MDAHTERKNNIDIKSIFCAFIKTVQSLVNLNPKLVNWSGSCEAATASLSLAQEQTTVINFTFSLVIFFFIPPHKAGAF